MKGLSLAICDRALAPGGAAPEWVHLLPEGHIKGRDGRDFELADPGALVLAFQSGGIDLPIDYEHQNDKPEAKLSGPVPAAGWIKELKAAAGGLWGRVEWTATAAEMIGRKEYRYLSPSILFHPKTRQIMHLKGAGLVHNPNLYLTALASQETPMLPPNKPQTPEAVNLAAELAKLLKLPADTPVQDLMAKVADLLKAVPDPAKFVPIEAVQDMLSDRRSERATLSAGRATDKVHAAVRQGYLTNGMRDWALALCASDERAFDSFLEKAGPTFAYLSKTSHAAQAYIGQPQDHAGSDLEAAVCAQLGLKPGTLAS
jgi:phage I-like protein